eukprot:TRINITY_DN3914_c0_g1_i3.p1 TRINITY_DN3914_c0_g1~~TRINITY_DN3914_c0_g1_i3.p1  ORF type:complete len:593 (+),score=128.16 TRINITY_DN3914_c0_g1_i3:163-1779(+)
MAHSVNIGINADGNSDVGYGIGFKSDSSDATGESGMLHALLRGLGFGGSAGKSDEVLYARAEPFSVNGSSDREILLPAEAGLEKAEGAQVPFKLSWIALAGIIYFSVGGGPFGFETVLLAADPSVCFWTLLAFALLWALPQAICIAELSTRYTRGYNEWVTAAGGTWIGFTHSLLRVCFNVLNNAVYAELFMMYFEELVQLGPWAHAGVTLGFEALVVAVNLVGVQIVGKASVGLLVIMLSPFVVMFCLAVPHLDFKMLVEFPSPASSIDVGLLVSVIMFNLMGWDFMGNVSGSARKPRRDVPLATSVALTLVLATYAVPLFSAISVVPADQYGDDLFTRAAGMLWGPLEYMVEGAAFLGLFGLGVTFMSTSSEAIAHSTDWQYIPKFVGKRFTSREVPWIVIVLQGCVAFLISIPWDYSALVQVQMWIFSLSTMVIMLSFIGIRFRTRNEARANNNFRVPLPFLLIVALCAPSIGLCIFALVGGDLRVIILGVGLCVVVVVMGTARELYFVRKRGWRWRVSEPPEPPPLLHGSAINV